MSRRNTRNRNTAIIDKGTLEQLIDAAIARRYTPPQGANVTPIPQNIIAQMMQEQAPQAKTGGMWEPGSPIKPIPGLAPPQGPRQWSYQYGYNIGQLPRSTEMTAFDTLRNLAGLYEVIPMCEEVWFDLAGKLELEIRVKPKHTVDAYGEPMDPKVLADKYGDRIRRWEDFFAMPDPENEQELHPWMQMLLKERLEVDAIAIFKRRDRIGRLFGLEPFDGATLKPLLNERGRKPNGDYPAYEQFIHGTPAMFLRRGDVIYNREIERVDSPYGFSRVEYIVLRINQILRKENKDLATFTAGNIPPGFFSPPDDGTTDWTPEQLLMMQEIWDSLLAGNDEVRSRGKWVPPGTTYTKTDVDGILVEFDEFITTVTCGAFGVPKTELSFTEKSNRSTGETQEAVIYRRPLATIRKLFSGIFNKVMAEEGDGDLEATWKGYEEPEDFKTKAEAEDILVKNGTMSTSQGARWLGIKPMVETEPFVTVPGQGIVFTSDAMDPQLREQSKQAKLAGYDQQQHPEAYNEQGAQPGTQGAQAGTAGKQGQSGGGAQANGKPASQSQSGSRANASTPAARSLHTVVPGQSSDAEREEYRRWRECAIRDVKASKPIRPFTTDIISEKEQNVLRQALERCETVEDVRQAFVDVKRDSGVGVDPADTKTWQEVEPEIQDALKRALDAGYTHGTWKETLIPCAACLMNRGAKVRLGETFPSGAYYTPNHNHCGCEIVLSMEDEA